jgi:HK97 family phage major capsid protein
MSINEITERVNSLGNAWEQFKHVNNQRLAEIERKGSADPLYLEQLGKINTALDHYKQRVDGLEVELKRPGVALHEVKSGSGLTPMQSEYKKAFCNYLRKGMDAGLEAFESKALSVGSDPDGGFLVTPAMSQAIVKTVTENSPLRAIASVETISTDSLEIIQDYNLAAAGWTTETGAVAETNTPQIAKSTITAFELYAQPKATQKLVDDSAIDIEAWVAQKVAEVFSKMENTAFISGNGTSQPKGILTYASGTSWGQVEQVNSGLAAGVTADGLIKLYYALKEDYARRATFIMNRAVLQSVRLLKEATTDQYLWQPGLAAGAPDTLLGVPVVQAVDMPVAAANSLSIAVGDFGRAYQIVDRIGIRTLRDPFTEKPFVKFYTTKRVGGAVVNFEALKLQRLAA